jgi:hypothetical protein
LTASAFKFPGEYLGSQKEFITSDTILLDALTNFCVIVVRVSSVDVSVANRQSGVNGSNTLFIFYLPGTKTKSWYRFFRS